MMEKSETFVRPKAAAAMFGVDLSTFYRWLRSGRLTLTKYKLDPENTSDGSPSVFLLSEVEREMRKIIARGKAA